MKNLYSQQKRCPGCKKIITNLSSHCHSCAQKGARNHHYIDGRSMKQYFCKDCGKELKDYKNLRCRKCAAKGCNNSNYKGGIPVCTDCGKQLSTRGCKKHPIKRCLDCLCKRRKGNNHPCWIDGRSFLKYPKEFNSVLRKKIQTRDSFKCQRCGLSKLGSSKKFQRNLSVHHIDYNKLNCIESNLLTLCIKCNTNVNKNRDYWYAYFTYIMENK